MIIGIAGPFSASTEEQRKRNLNKLNEAAARLLDAGHTPIIGVNAALPVVRLAQSTEPYEGIMRISMALLSCCDALYIMAESPGALREKEWMMTAGKSIYFAFDEIPEAL